MICSWPRIARDVFQRCGQSTLKSRALCSRIPQFSRPSIIKNNENHPSIILSQCRRASTTLTQLELCIRPTISRIQDLARPGVLEIIEKSFNEPLTPARLASSAAYAIRLSLANGNLPDAYLIINSIHYAKYQPKSLFFRMVGSFQTLEVFKPSAISFHPDTPIRLVSHCLLHGLLRQGHIEQASVLAQQMMKNGIRMHKTSLEMLFECIAPLNNVPALSRPRVMLESINILRSRLYPHFARDSGSSHALKLLQLARDTRQKRSNRMYRTLITLCVINGEIIVASLLFGLLVKDWNAHVTATVGDALNVGEASSQRTTAKQGGDDCLTPWPSKAFLFTILQPIERTLKVRDHLSEPHFTSFLQALANLAVLLENNLIPFVAASPLLKILLQAQNVQGKVWIPDKRGDMHQVHASGYFDSVLENLIRNLPTGRIPDSGRLPLPCDSDLSFELQPGVHTASSIPLTSEPGTISGLRTDSPERLKPRVYNLLLRYALLHRHSPVLADKVVQYMNKEGVRPTWFISDCYRQAAIILQDRDLWRKACLLEVQTNHRIVEVNESDDLTLAYSSLLRVNQSPQQLEHKIDFLVSIGHPEAVIQHIPDILPGIDKTRCRSQRPDETDAEYAEYQRHRGLKRSVVLGPRIYISLLNAIRKSSHPGIAEQVWLYAKKAEKLSWANESREYSGPWCLPIQAYTIMLQIYGKEARRANLYRRVDTKNSSPRIELRDQQKFARIRGWGIFSQLNEAGKAKDRGTVGREMGMIVYRAALSAYSHFHELMKILSNTVRKEYCPQLQLPKPDSIFYNAILDIAGRHPEMLPRSNMVQLPRVRKKFILAERSFERSGRRLRSEEDDLLVVGRDMLDAGHPIPPGLRHLFVGHKLDYDRGPAAMEAWRKRSVYRLTVRSKGVPRFWTRLEHRSKKDKRVQYIRSVVESTDVIKNT